MLLLHHVHFVPSALQKSKSANHQHAKDSASPSGLQTPVKATQAALFLTPNRISCLSPPQRTVSVDSPASVQSPMFATSAIAERPIVRILNSASILMQVDLPAIQKLHSRPASRASSRPSSTQSRRSELPQLSAAMLSPCAEASSNAAMLLSMNQSTSYAVLEPVPEANVAVSQPQTEIHLESKFLIVDSHTLSKAGLPQSEPTADAGDALDNDVKMTHEDIHGVVSQRQTLDIDNVNLQQELHEQEETKENAAAFNEVEQALETVVHSQQPGDALADQMHTQQRKSVAVDHYEDAPMPVAASSTVTGLNTVAVVSPPIIRKQVGSIFVTRKEKPVKISPEDAAPTFTPSPPTSPVRSRPTACTIAPPSSSKRQAIKHSDVPVSSLSFLSSPSMKLTAARPASPPAVAASDEKASVSALSRSSRFPHTTPSFAATFSRPSATLVVPPLASVTASLHKRKSKAEVLRGALDHGEQTTVAMIENESDRASNSRKRAHPSAASASVPKPMSAAKQLFPFSHRLPATPKEEFDFYYAADRAMSSRGKRRKPTPVDETSTANASTPITTPISSLSALSPAAASSAHLPPPKASAAVKKSIHRAPPSSKDPLSPEAILQHRAALHKLQTPELLRAYALTLLDAFEGEKAKWASRLAETQLSTSR